MCEYSELRMRVTGPIMTARLMQPHELKSLVEAGAYKPDPGEIAMAMLSRHGVRELLTGLQPAAHRNGHSPDSPVARPRAA
jgi:hypothetical protein